MNSSSRSRGSALVEMALVLPFMLLFIFATIDFGQLVQTRLVLTNVAREGGSIASRQSTLDAGVPTMLVSAAHPLALGGADGKVCVSRITCGTTAKSPNPVIATQLVQGGLGVASGVQAGAANLGLTPVMYNHLVYNATNGVADISEVTVVEIFYRYRPITPLPNFAAKLLSPNGAGMILSSRAVF